MTQQDAARRQIAESLLPRFDKFVGQCKVDDCSFLHAGVQHEHSPGVVLMHQYVCVGSIVFIDELVIGEKG